MRGLQVLGDLDESDVRRCLDEGEDVRGVCLDPGSAPVAPCCPLVDVPRRGQSLSNGASGR
jgi:hypothetical protein